jgi:PAT family beta-lactamase induction signal transducer AmpG
MAAILLLGIASGLPYALMDDAFRGWMTKAQLDLRTIGWFSLISLPYSLKFLWSPFLDRFVPPRLGRRRGWMVIGQLGLVVTIAILALQMAAIGPGSFAHTGLSAATRRPDRPGDYLSQRHQDIAIDAYRTDVLEEREMGAGAATYVLGYRIAIL